MAKAKKVIKKPVAKKVTKKPVAVKKETAKKETLKKETLKEETVKTETSKPVATVKQKPESTDKIIKQIELGECTWGIVKVLKDKDGKPNGSIDIKLLSGASPFGGLSMVKTISTGKKSLFEEYEGEDTEALYYHVTPSEGTKIIDSVKDLSIIMIKD